MDDRPPIDKQALAYAVAFRSFYHFLFGAFHAVKGFELEDAPFIGLLASRLQDVAEGRCERLIVTLPPRLLKSFTVSVAWTAWYLGHNPGRDVMAVSYGQALADELAADCRALMQSDFYRGVFGDVLAGGRPKLSTLKTAAGGGRRATSIEGVSTGVGCDKLIFDDPQRPNETLSERVRTSTNAAYTNTFHSRQNNPTSPGTIIVMQRLHEADFVGNALGLGGEPWEVLNLPAIAEHDEEHTYRAIDGLKTYRRRTGDALHPTRLPLSVLEDTRRTIGEALFATQYMQRPAPAGGGLVKEAWFKRYTPAERPAEFDEIVQSWDTANTTAEWSDYSVCTTWGVKGKQIYLLHVLRQRLLYPDLKPTVLNLASRFSADVVLIEDRASGTQLLQDLRRADFGRCRAVKPVHDKMTRMINQTAVIENGRVSVPADEDWAAEYLRELTLFPNGRHDDQVDSSSQALDYISDNRFKGWAVMEFYRREAMARSDPNKGDIVTFSIPPGATEFRAQDGTVYRPDTDGLLRVARADVGVMWNEPTWKLVRDPE